MFGNILLVLSLICYGLLAGLLSKPRPGGDYGVGYSFVYLCYGAGFVFFTGLLAWNMNLNHCFDWVLRYRSWLVLLGWIAFVTMTLWSLEYHMAFILLHLSVFGACLYLINVQQPAGLPALWVKMPFYASLLLGLVVLGAIGKTRAMKAVQKIQLNFVWQSNRQKEYKATLDKIKNYNDTTINWLLEFADPRMDKELRTNAIAQIRAFPNWEDEMIAILMKDDRETVWAYYDHSNYVYAFLEGNKVEHPEKFIEPLKYSLQVSAVRAESDLSDPYKRELWSLNLESFCRALDAQFKEYAKEFKPGMLKLQEVLSVEYPERIHEPSIKRYNKLVKTYRLAVKNWLAANQ